MNVCNTTYVVATVTQIRSAVNAFNVSDGDEVNSVGSIPTAQASTLFCSLKGNERTNTRFDTYSVATGPLETVGFHPTLLNLVPFRDIELFVDENLTKVASVEFIALAHARAFATRSPPFVLFALFAGKRFCSRSIYD